MTKNESFKRRIRDRMAGTGERYAAARRVLLDQAAAKGRRRRWVSEPDRSDDAVRAATGRGWDEWCDLIDSWPGHVDGHTAIAAHLRDDHGIDSWWAQAVTVGYERITGRRLPYQMADGTFTASRSRTLAIDADALRAMLLDDVERSVLLPGLATERRSGAAARSPRIALDRGVALFTIEPREDGRATVTVSHERLTSPEEREKWRFYWSEWLDAVGEGWTPPER